MIAITTLILLCIGTGSSIYWGPRNDWSVHQAIDIQSVRHHPNTIRRSVQVATRSAPNCQTEVDTSTTDNNNAEVKSLLLVPDLPNVCYVRDISQAELQSTTLCDPRPVSARDEHEASNQRRYFAGGEISANQLPENLRDQCEGRRIISLIEVPTMNGDSSEEHNRGGSANTCLEITVVTPRLYCPRKQRGWYFKK